ncbi:hypothetical protein Goshw_001982, partial [Gossypium schwendimanii]|nr:hypothetical protein [Gossypium schwendimanii]
ATVSIKNHRYRESFLVTKNYHPERNTFFFFLAFNSLLLCLLFAATCHGKRSNPRRFIEMGFARFLQDFEICIWYHLGRGHIGLTMKAKLYRLLEQRGSDCRYFVIPLWRGSGYTTMFGQVQLPYMLFTGLEDYKARGTQASPYFTASFYTEFAESKDLVLIRGDIVFTSKLTDEEAKWLLETTQSFYLNDVRYKLVECFNKEPRDFEF